MNKLYDRIDFVNNMTPALNETNLNTMSKALDDIDDRVIDIAGDVLVVVPEILDKYADIEALATNPPYIGNNGHWWTWDTDLNQYVDSGVDAGVSVNVGTTTTLSPGSSATVTNSGTDTDPILNFGIPQGVAGQDGQDGTDGQDGVSPEVTITTITDGHTVTITDADHPTGQSFNVMDGTNGQGVPASGTTGQVLTKASNADYDTTWTTPSGGSGGHTIINDDGISMTQRDGLQFSGLDVTDDSVNDKTIVTLPTPDYVDEQFNSSTSYIAGDTFIHGNKRYRVKANCINIIPPNSTYYEELSVATELVAEKALYDGLEDRVEILEATIKPAIVTILKGTTHPNITVTRNTSYFNYSYSNNILLFKATNTSMSAGFFINHDFSQYLGNGYKLVIKYAIASSGSTITSLSDVPTNMTVYHSYGSSDQSTEGTGKQALVATDSMRQAIINGTAISERQYLILSIDSFFTSTYKYLLFWMGVWGTKFMTWAIEEIYIV